MYLNAKTYFSYKYGVLSTEELVKGGVEIGAQALAVTNINNTADCWDFLSYCSEYGVKGIIGVEIRNGDELLYLILARSVKGIKAINAFLTLHLQASEPFPQKCTLNEEVWVIYPLSNATVKELKAHEFIGIQPTEITRLFGCALPLEKCVVRQPVTFKDKRGYNLHRLLRAIAKNTLLSKLQLSKVAGPLEYFLSPSELINQFKLYPSIITNTLRVIDSCHYEFQFQTDKNKKCFTASCEDDRILLEKLATDGMYLRFGKSNKEAHKRVRKELGIIHELGFNAYFLITSEISMPPGWMLR